MSVDNKALRAGIIEKLKIYDAYIDNELPDYIMVMVANRKTLHQINNDLHLFLGEHTDKFTAWLQDVLSHPELLQEKQQQKVDDIPEEKISLGSKRPSDRESHIDAKVVKQSDNSHTRSIVQKVKISPSRGNERPRGDNTEKPRSTRDQDLRCLIRQRRAGAASDAASSSGKVEEGEISDDEGDEFVSRGSVASVVRLPDKQPRPRNSSGTGRLLQRAIQGIHGGKSLSSRHDRKTIRTSSREKKEQTSRSSIDDAQSDVQLQEDDFVDEFREETEKVAAYDIDVEEEEEVEERVNETKKNVGKMVDNDSEDGEVKKPVVAAASPEVVEAAMIAAVKKILPGGKNTVDLREVLNKTKKEDGTKFVVTMEGLGDKYSYVDNLPVEGTVEEEPIEEIDDDGRTRGGMPERCRFWPNCKNGDSCPYLHPKTPCRLFPNCKYGNKCCFVHPQCKFDARCTKPDCPYMHTTRRAKALPSPVMPMTAGTGMGIGTGPFTYPGTMVWPRQTRYPNKSALSWSPASRGRGKGGVSERQFAVPDNQSTSMSVQ